MTVENKSLGEAINEVTDESLGVSDDSEETTGDGQDTTETDTETETTEEGGEETEEESTEEETEESTEEADEPDFFDNLTPDQLQAIKNNPELNSLRKGLLKGYETKTTELKQLVQLGESWKQDPRRVVQALAEAVGMSVSQAKAVADATAAAGATAPAGADPLEEAGKELESLFGNELGPRVRKVFDKWADARIGKSLGTEVTPLKNAVGQVLSTNEQNRMFAEETAFKSRHKDLPPAIEKRIVELGNSGKFVPGKGQTPSDYLEALYDIATAQISRESAKKASSTAAKTLARKIETNRKDREPSGVSGRGGSVKPVSKISEARNISEALDMAEAELRAEGL